MYQAMKRKSEENARWPLNRGMENKNNYCTLSYTAYSSDLMSEVVFLVS